MKRVVAAILLLLACATQPVPAQSSDVRADALDEALALIDMERFNLGWTVKGWWPRFPVVPYKLRAFDSLFAAPLDTVTYTRSFATAMWDRLDPERLDDRDGRGAGGLFQAVQQLGIDPKFGGFRGYSVNLRAPLMPLDQAILEVTKLSGRTVDAYTFGMELPYPKPAEALAEKVKVLPEGVSPILGQLMLNVATAHRWAELAFRNVDARDRLVVATRYDVGEEMIDAYDYCPEMDDVAQSIDEASLWYAAQISVQALDDARVALKKLGLPEVPQFGFDWETPLGWVRIRGGGDDAIGVRDESASDALLIVDLAGDDLYEGGVAASTVERPIGLLLDMGGDDIYKASGPAQGAGMAGVGILIDAHGDDTYRAGRYAQGVGQFGLGLCADLAGKDSYSADYSAQGCGYFGIGLLFDVTGADSYRLLADGQGLGGVAGVGVLADRVGADRYEAVRQHSITGRPSYHSPKLDVGVSNAQGCGMGRRGDGADGHSWAGGIGALLDGRGDDVYTSGNWAMGTGYWFGIGLLHDGAGDDRYNGSIYTQASGAHFCIGVLIDEAGHDQHLSQENSRNSLAWGHDFTVALLLNIGGDDRYSIGADGMAYSINRSVSMLIDIGGNDSYSTEKLARPGFAKNDERFRARDGISTYFADTSSIGLFLDVGGEDTYWEGLANNSHLLDKPDSPNPTDRNFSVFVDRAGGDIDFTPLPVKMR